MNKNELIKLFGKSFAEAIERDCEKNGWSVCQFFEDFVHWWAGDVFFDFMMELCDKYHIIVEEDDWVLTESL